MNIVILGGGESGVGAALLAKHKGFSVFLSDKSLISNIYKEILLQNKIEFEEGQHTEEKILKANEVVKSPGIPDKVEIIKKLKEKGIPIVSEIEFASRYTKAKLVGITGSNGKTTTTLLIYHLFQKAGLKVGIAGNIGESFAKQVIEDKFDWFVLEISSFQLDNCYDFHPHIAILTNITPDHLDRYEYRFQNYIDSKFRIAQNLDENDYFIYFKDDPVIQKELDTKVTKAKRLSVSLSENKDSDACFIEKENKITVQNSSIPVSDLPLKGKHNAANMMAAILAVTSAKVQKFDFVEALKDFKGAPHRLEEIAQIEGITFVNDSKATNVDSVFYALDSFQSPTILIIGGVDKGNDYTQIEELVKQKVKAVICLGKDNEKLISFFGQKVNVIKETQDIKEAVKWGLELGQKGDIVLLSPACASFDLFKNYEDRGNQFRDAVLELNS